MKQDSQLPILYSLRNCPYAMRARLAIYASEQSVRLRDIVLSNKPDEMLTVSPKGTVPVLVLTGNMALSTDKRPSNDTDEVIDESLSIMLWAFSQNDPDDYLVQATPNARTKMLKVINLFDNDFKHHLEQYRSAKRYHEPTLKQHRQVCERYLEELESRLEQHAYLESDKPSLLDLALMPYIRQFARVERQWYLQSPYPQLRQWLNRYLQSKMFSKVMAQHPLWLDTQEEVIFG